MGFMFIQIMYRPVKELTGIPGANKLVICLTGYQGPERDDIMVCVSSSVRPPLVILVVIIDDYWK